METTAITGNRRAKVTEKKAIKIDRVILPNHEGKTLADQDDIIIWTKFNILLQAVDELTAEHGHAGDASRQLRLITQEAVRRDMFGISIRDREPTDENLWSWYEVLKQLLAGERKGEWEETEGTDRQYTQVIHALKERGHEMPKQNIDLEALDMLGEIIT